MDCNLRSIGAKALQKHGEEGLTLFQLSQVEAEGLWGERPIHFKEPCTIHRLQFKKGPEAVYEPVQLKMDYWQAIDVALDGGKIEGMYKDRWGEIWARHGGSNNEASFGPLLQSDTYQTQYVFLC